MLEQGQPIHARHVDVADNEIDIAIRLDLLEPFLAITSKIEHEFAVPDFAPELALNQRLKVALIVDNKDFRWHG
jgi:hypothetical protein